LLSGEEVREGVETWGGGRRRKREGVGGWGRKGKARGSEGKVRGGKGKVEEKSAPKNKKKLPLDYCSYASGRADGGGHWA